MRLNELEQLEQQKRWQRAANLYTQDKLMILLQAPASSPHTINISVLAPCPALASSGARFVVSGRRRFYSELRNIFGRDTPASKRICFISVGFQEFSRMAFWFW
jgi:hypothetical protein